MWFVAEQRIGPGEAVIMPFQLSEYGALGVKFDSAPGLGSRAGEVMFFGRLAYIDERGDERSYRRVAVFRRRLSDDGTFYRTDNPDHEYSD